MTQHGCREAGVPVSGPAHQGLYASTAQNIFERMPVQPSGQPHRNIHSYSATHSYASRAPPHAVTDWSPYTAAQSTARGSVPPTAVHMGPQCGEGAAYRTAAAAPPAWNAQSLTYQSSAHASSSRARARPGEAMYQPHPRTSWAEPHAYSVYRAGQQNLWQGGSGGIKAYNAGARVYDVPANQVRCVTSKRIASEGSESSSLPHA